MTGRLRRMGAAGGSRPGLLPWLDVGLTIGAKEDSAVGFEVYQDKAGEWRWRLRIVADAC